ncbi:MAG: rhodanese-like domain-containing protein [Pseudomonadota bacterium]
MNYGASRAARRCFGHGKGLPELRAGPPTAREGVAGKRFWQWRGFLDLSDQGIVKDASCQETWAALRDDGKAVLIDVRTRSEWAFVGLPDLAELGKNVLAIEWQTFPHSELDPEFTDRLQRQLENLGVGATDPLFFICRSGGRSRMAAEAMRHCGYSKCINVADGFEGPLDANRHRGTVAGWKKDGLPWVQG